MATTLPNTGAIIPAMTEPADQAVNNAAFTKIDTAIGLLQCGYDSVGTPAVNTNYSKVIVFPKPFADSNYAVIVTGATGSPDTFFISAVKTNPESFTVYARRTTGTSLSFFWMAYKTV